MELTYDESKERRASIERARAQAKAAGFSDDDVMEYVLTELRVNYGCATREDAEDLLKATNKVYMAHAREGKANSGGGDQVAVAGKNAADEVVAQLSIAALEELLLKKREEEARLQARNSLPDVFVGDYIRVYRDAADDFRVRAKKNGRETIRHFNDLDKANAFAALIEKIVAMAVLADRLGQ